LGVLVIAGFIFYTSILTVPPEVGVEEDVFGLLANIVGFAQDKWRHFPAYGTLSYALAYATENWALERWTRAVVVVVVVALYGIGIEVGQYMTPVRFFSVADIIANTLGAVLVLPWYLVRPYVELVDMWEVAEGFS
jgi:hypothetical protein